MKKTLTTAGVIGLILSMLLLSGGTPPNYTGDKLTVVSVLPVPHEITAPMNTPIIVDFDRPVRRESVTVDNFWAFGRWSGTAVGAFSFSNGDRTVTLQPDNPFSAGEHVMVILSHDLIADDGSPMRSAGFSYQFCVKAQPADLEFNEIDSLSTRTKPNINSRAYGGIATDLNRDGWLDITVVNEDTADLRVFLNRADGTGLFDDFLRPTFPVNDRASPSEPADFNHDGIADICVANINTNSVSILLGIGDGSFSPQQEVTVGGQPRGITVLDADGDGDIDIANTNSASNNMSLLLNDGNGIFGAPIFFEGGGNGEWALAAADMNDDGILDLVIGARSGREILIAIGNGNASFTHISSQNSGGSVWMLVCGDLNGDGNEDVTTANSTSNNGAILLGNGAGGLATPTTYVTDSFPLATDLGDLDGDDDLDWVTSSFSGDWFVFTNDGDGTFTFNQEILAPRAASCALALDVDNDHDLDLALIDEIADVVVLMKNSGTAIPPDDFLVVYGAHISGGLDDFKLSDDSYLAVMEQPAVSILSPSIRVEVMTTFTGIASQFTFMMELSCTAAPPVVLQRLELYNYAAKTWDIVDERFATPTDSVVTHSPPTPGDYIESGTGELKARVSLFDPGTLFTPGWVMKIDQVHWSFFP